MLNMDKPITILYSPGMDFTFAAALVKYFYPHATCIPLYYGGTFPYDKVRAGEQVVLIGMTYDSDTMDLLDDKYDLTWITHHDKAIKEATSRYFNPKGLRASDRCTTLLTWEYLSKEPVPRVVSLIDDYSRWALKDENSVRFFYGFSKHKVFPNDNGMETYCKLIRDVEGVLDEMISVGKTIEEFNNELNGYLCDECVYEHEVNGYSVLSANTRGTNSLLFESCLGGDIYHTYAYSGKTKRFKHSVYAARDGVDVTEFATAFGARGGTPGVSGFDTQFTIGKLPTPTEENKPEVDIEAIEALNMRMLRNPITRSHYLNGTKFLMGGYATKTMFRGTVSATMINTLVLDPECFFQYSNPGAGLGVSTYMHKSGWYKAIVYRLNSNSETLEVWRELGGKENTTILGLVLDKPPKFS